MRTLSFLVAGVLFLLPDHAVLAQSAKPSKPSAPALKEKTASLFEGATVAGEDVAFQADINLTFKGNAMTAGVLDACVTTDRASVVSDRVKAQLSVQGNDLSAKGTTDLSKDPFELHLKKSGNAETIALSGTLTIGGQAIALKAEDVALQPYEPSSDADEAPPGSPVPSFNTLSIKTPLPAMKSVTQVLREQQAVLSPYGVIPGCPEMRAGSAQLQATIAPQKAAAALGKLNAVSGVQAKLSDTGDVGMVVRLAGAAAEKDLVATVGETVLSVTGGRQVDHTAYDEQTGEYRIDVQRDSVLAKRAGLAERLSTEFLIGKDAKDGATYIVVSPMAVKLVDPAAQQPLKLLEGAEYSEEGETQTGTNGSALDAQIVENLAKAVKGQTWNSESDSWK